jgi:hypothetical protein
MFACVAPALARGRGVAVEDIFGRRLNDKNGLVLVDWEGHMANPAIEFFVVAPTGASYPIRVTVSSDEPRMYFNLPSEAGTLGPKKTIDIARPGKQSVFVSIFPDRDDRDETHELKIELRDARGRQLITRLPVHVIDQDRKGDGGFPITVDFSKDKTGFFAREKNADVIRQAARDWMYFFDGTGLDPVPAGAEKSFIRNPDSFKEGFSVVNDREYTGLLLYASGVHTPENRSGGMPSHLGGFQSIGGKPTQIRRSAGIRIETEGNYKQKGWIVSLDDTDWWRAKGDNNVPGDLYSVAHHEMGHAFFFNPNLPLFARLKEGISSDDKQLLEYFGSSPRPDDRDHFSKQIDPESGFGVYGNEYYGQMPQGRWVPTKTDLLLAQAIGYRLRPTSAFAPLTFEPAELPGAKVSAKYSARLHATGGIPFYNWEVMGTGKLPPGLRLDSFTGELQGTPTRAGKYQFTVRVRDYHKLATGKEAEVTLEVKQ